MNDQDQGEGQERGPDPAGRLTGEEAGWHAMHRNLAAAAALADAEAYAAGERRVTVEHPGASELEVTALDVLVSGLVYGRMPRGQVSVRTTSTSTATTWGFNGAGSVARLSARFTRELIDHANPGHWTVTADEH